MENTSIEKKIYFVRHGKSDAQGKNMFHDGEPKLTELGAQQATFVAERLRNVDAGVILTSPMSRALHTAQTIQETTSVPLEETALLREFVPPSSLVGKEKATPEGQAYIHDMLEHLHDADWHHSDEENYYDMHTRAMELLDLFIARPENSIIAVTHAGFMRVLFTTMMTEGKADPDVTRMLMRFLRPMNTGVTIAQYNSENTRRNKWRLITWNDHAHLAETETEEPQDYFLQ